MIEVKDLYFTYPHRTTATLRGLNFTIDRGEIFGFLGPSGAGKSTIQKILIGILKKYEGIVRVMDKDLKNIDSTYYEKIGVAFEFPNFYSRFTAKENLQLFRSLYSGETDTPERLLAMVGLEKYANIKVSDFSKGMKMRLNFCRALLNKPDLLFLDEPTSGLDPVNAKRMKDLILEKKAEGKTILITTHNMTVAEEICDRIAFIVDGKISLIDSPRELMIQRGSKKIEIEYLEGESKRVACFPMEGLGTNLSFLQIIREKEIRSIHSQEQTLEEIFIEVTGRRLA